MIPNGYWLLVTRMVIPYLQSPIRTLITCVRVFGKASHIIVTTAIIMTTTTNTTTNTTTTIIIIRNEIRGGRAEARRASDWFYGK